MSKSRDTVKSTVMLMNSVSANGRLPSDARETVRDVLYYLRKRQELSKKPSPKGFKIFDNREGFLPKISKKDSRCYYEAVVGTARDGTTGKRRIVLLVEGHGNEFKRCIAKYYSNSHYGHDPGTVPFFKAVH